MTALAEKWMTELVNLSQEERGDLAALLIQSLDAPPVPTTEEELAVTLNRRSQELKDGTVRGIPAEEVHARLRQKYGIDAI
jgi:putative addiction module component (TIGR02574 family)